MMIRTIKFLDDNDKVQEAEVWICDKCESCVSFILTRDEVLCCACRAPQVDYFTERAQGLH